MAFLVISDTLQRSPIAVKSEQGFHVRPSFALSDALHWLMIAMKSRQGLVRQSRQVQVKKFSFFLNNECR